MEPIIQLLSQLMWKQQFNKWIKNPQSIVFHTNQHSLDEIRQMTTQAGFQHVTSSFFKGSYKGMYVSKKATVTIHKADYHSMVVITITLHEKEENQGHVPDL